jgi:hypothetical protein
MSIKSLLNQFFVVLMLAMLCLQPSRAQDLFQFPDEDPVANNAQPGAVQDDGVVPDAANIPGSDQDPLQQDDPLMRDDLTVRPTQPAREPGGFQFPGDEEDTPGQAVVLKSKFAGWEQAGPGVGGRRLTDELRANWVMVNSNGRFTGQVVKTQDADLEDMFVQLMSMGRLVKEAKVDQNGFFEFSNVPEGPYALIGTGENAFFAFGLIILDFNEKDIAKVRNHIRVMAMQNKTTINTDWIRHYSPRVSFRVFGRYPEAEGLDDPPRLYGIQGLSANMPTALPATSIDSRPVERTTSGGVLGRVHQMNSINGRPVDVRTTRILLLQGDDVIAATDADNYGVFYFPFVEVGQYGLLAAGVDGVGLIGIEIIDATDRVLMNEGGEIVPDQPAAPAAPYPFAFAMVSAETVGWLNHYASELAYRRNLLAPRRPDESQRMCAGCEGAGCQHCQGTGLCTSRSQSFEDWAANCLGQEQRTRLGSGYILSEASKDLRRIVDRGNQYFENAFYGSQEGGYGGAQYGNPGYGYQNGYGNPGGNPYGYGAPGSVGGQYFDGGQGYQFNPTPATGMPGSR